MKENFSFFECNSVARSAGNHEPEIDVKGDSNTNCSDTGDSSPDEDSTATYKPDGVGVGIVKSLLGPSIEDAVLRTLEFGKSLIQKADDNERLAKDKKPRKEPKSEIKGREEPWAVRKASVGKGDGEPDVRAGQNGLTEERSTRKRIVFTAKLDKDMPLFSESSPSAKKLTNVSKIRSLDSDLKQGSPSPEKIKRQLEALIQINKDEPPEHAGHWSPFFKGPNHQVEVTVMPSLYVCRNQVDLSYASTDHVNFTKDPGSSNQGSTSRNTHGLRRCPPSVGGRAGRGIRQAPEILSSALGPTLDVSIINNLKMIRDLFTGAKDRETAEPTSEGESTGARTHTSPKTDAEEKLKGKPTDRGDVIDEDENLDETGKDGSKDERSDDEDLEKEESLRVSPTARRAFNRNPSANSGSSQNISNQKSAEHLNRRPTTGTAERITEKKSRGSKSSEISFRKASSKISEDSKDDSNASCQDATEGKDLKERKSTGQESKDCPSLSERKSTAPSVKERESYLDPKERANHLSLRERRSTAPSIKERESYLDPKERVIERVSENLKERDLYEDLRRRATINQPELTERESNLRERRDEKERDEKSLRERRDDKERDDKSFRERRDDKERDDKSFRERRDDKERDDKSFRDRRDDKERDDKSFRERRNAQDPKERENHQEMRRRAMVNQESKDRTNVLSLRERRNTLQERESIKTTLKDTDTVNFESKEKERGGISQATLKRGSRDRGALQDSRVKNLREESSTKTVDTNVLDNQFSKSKEFGYQWDSSKDKAGFSESQFGRPGEKDGHPKSNQDKRLPFSKEFYAPDDEREENAQDEILDSPKAKTAEWKVEEMQKKLQDLENKEKNLKKHIAEEEKEREKRRKFFAEEEQFMEFWKTQWEEMGAKHPDHYNYEKIKWQVALEEEKLARLKNQSELYKREISAMQALQEEKSVTQENEKPQKEASPESLKRNKSLLDAWDVIASRVCHTRLPSFSRAYDLERKSFQAASAPINVHCCFLSQGNKAITTVADAFARKSRSRSRCVDRCLSKCESKCFSKCGSKCGSKYGGKCGNKCGSKCRSKSATKSVSKCDSRYPSKSRSRCANNRLDVGPSRSADSQKMPKPQRPKPEEPGVFPMQRDITCGLHQSLKPCVCKETPKNEYVTCSSDEAFNKKIEKSCKKCKNRSELLCRTQKSSEKIIGKPPICKNLCRSKSDTAVRPRSSAKIVKVLWAVTRINIFQDNCRTYEVMDATPTPPCYVPVKTEGIFVVRNPPKRAVPVGAKKTCHISGV